MKPEQCVCVSMLGVVGGAGSRAFRLSGFAVFVTFFVMIVHFFNLSISLYFSVIPTFSLHSFYVFIIIIITYLHPILSEVPSVG